MSAPAAPAHKRSVEYTRSEDMCDDTIKTAARGAGAQGAVICFGFGGHWSEAMLDACAIATVEPNAAGAGPKRGVPLRYENPFARAITTRVA